MLNSGNLVIVDKFKIVFRILDVNRFGDFNNFNLIGLLLILFIKQVLMVVGDMFSGFFDLECDLILGGVWELMDQIDKDFEVVFSNDDCIFVNLFLIGLGVMGRFKI